LAQRYRYYDPGVGQFEVEYQPWEQNNKHGIRTLNTRHVTQEQNNGRSMDMRAEQLAVEDITWEWHWNDGHRNRTIGVTTLMGVGHPLKE
jgi:hypothetical protein